MSSTAQGTMERVRPIGPIGEREGRSDITHLQVGVKASLHLPFYSEMCIRGFQGAWPHVYSRGAKWEEIGTAPYF